MNTGYKRNPVTHWTGGYALSADARLALAAPDSRLQLWDAVSSQLLRTLEGHATPVTDCALSASGQLGISVSFDRRLCVWDTTTGAEIAHWKHDFPLWCCALSADGRIAVAGDGNGGVHLLEVVGIVDVQKQPYLDLRVS